MGGGHAPAEHGLLLDPLEDEVLHQEADQDHGEEPGEHQVGVQVEAVLVDEPPQPESWWGYESAKRSSPTIRMNLSAARQILAEVAAPLDPPLIVSRKCASKESGGARTAL